MCEVRGEHEPRGHDLGVEALARPGPVPEEDHMTVRLHHVALTVTDIEASTAWYIDLFGFVELVRA